MREGDGEAVVTVFANSTDVSLARPVSVRFTTMDNTASAGEDYTSITSTLTFDSQRSEISVSIPITDDSLLEELEDLSVYLSSDDLAVRLTSASATVFISDNDSKSEL